MMVKSGLESFILKFTEPLQRYLLTCEANFAFLERWLGYVSNPSFFLGRFFLHWAAATSRWKILDNFSSSFLSQKCPFQACFLHIPFLVLLGFTQNLQILGFRSPLSTPSCILLESASKVATSPTEEPATPIHGSQGPRGVNKLERTLIFLIIIRVLSSTSSNSRIVFGDVSAILIRRSSPIRNLKKSRDFKHLYKELTNLGINEIQF